MYSDEKHVITCPAVVIWDGITQPETKQQGKVVHSIKVALPPNSPEIQEVTALATTELNQGMWKGNLPNGGNWPVKVAGVDEIDPSVNGFTVINAKTYNGAPQIFDPNGKQLSPMEYGSQIYPGALVQIIVHAYSYDNKNKGISFGLDGILIVDATRPRLAISGGIDAAKAFGFGGTPTATGAPTTPPPATGASAPGQTAPPAANVPPAGITPAPDFLNPPTGPTMTAKANGAKWEAFVANGWTEEAARAQGYIV